MSLARSLLGAYIRAGTLLIRGLGIVLATLLGVTFVLILLALVVAVPLALMFAIYKAFPDEITPKPDGSWLDLIFGDQYVVFAARIVLLSLALVLLFGGIYMAISIFVRMYRREWLKRAGGFEAAVAERTADAVAESEQEYAGLVDQLIEENDALTTRLEGALERLEEYEDEEDPNAEPPEWLVP